VTGLSQQRCCGELHEYLYILPGGDAAVPLSSERLALATERHHLALGVSSATNPMNPIEALRRADNVGGVVVGMTAGVPDRPRLQLIAAALARGLRVWLYWPAEHAVEYVDAERFRSLRRHRYVLLAMEKIGRRVSHLVEARLRLRPGQRWIYGGRFPVSRDELLSDLERRRLDARPVPFRDLRGAPSASRPLDGGLYLRTDFWVRMVSGGSYGHTCYVAKELATSTRRFACLLPQRYDLLDALGVPQAVMDSPTGAIDEDAMATASEHYYPIVKTACALARPSFIYERLCLGNWVAATISRELQIPYIVEYNGSEIAMQRGYSGTQPYYTDVFLAGEAFAFRQATAISVISEPVRADLVSRGVDARKILVNPNGADLDSYARPSAEEARAVRRELGFRDDECVVCFTGTFGWWHGVDVLGAAIPRICREMLSVRVLLIGDGNYKAQLDEQIASHQLNDRVVSVGRVPQAEGARLLKAADIFVSPHSRHMVDGKFFGSPTKVFEYMAMGGGIVASALEQIGEVLSPALRPSDLARPDLRVTDERAVLCAPGDVDEFVAGVVGLARRPALISALGRNARGAVEACYSWKRHVERLWAFVADLAREDEARPLETADAYKAQIQSQWNHNPVGSEGASTSQPHTLDWFLEVERTRYGTYAPWMPHVMEFAEHRGERVLEIGGGMGTDLAQFAKHGGIVTDVDLSEGHLRLAEENFRLRGLNGSFVHDDAESLPFDSNTFDLVYSNGVLHHTPNTAAAIAEIRRVLKPGGRTIAMVYAENSLQYWGKLVWELGVTGGELSAHSMGDIMSRSVERSGNEARPLVKVYTKARLRALFRDFTNVTIVHRQISPELLPRALQRFVPIVERVAGWNLILKARKPSVA
jgi:glycosyltransferase involved in cell wall biosynthesis/ubiquinone/menaquinone biosynthesis C-methylase UbiE